MSDTPEASPAAYVATLAPFDLQHPSLRRLRLSARQTGALSALRVPILLTSPSPLTPRQQAELQIQDAVARILKGRAISAVLYRDQDAGDVSIWDGDQWLTIADTELGLPAQAVAA